jgi:hypothetical protein
MIRVEQRNRRRLALGMVALAVPMFGYGIQSAIGGTRGNILQNPNGQGYVLAIPEKPVSLEGSGIQDIPQELQDRAVAQISRDQVLSKLGAEIGEQTIAGWYDQNNKLTGVTVDITFKRPIDIPEGLPAMKVGPDIISKGELYEPTVNSSRFTGVTKVRVFFDDTKRVVASYTPLDPASIVDTVDIKSNSQGK